METEAKMIVIQVCRNSQHFAPAAATAAAVAAAATPVQLALHQVRVLLRLHEQHEERNLSGFQQKISELTRWCQTLSSVVLTEGSRTALK